MNKLQFQDIFFLRMKLQKSINLPKSPLNQRKILFTSKNFQNFQDSDLQRQRHRTNKKVSTEQDLNYWLLKKQLKLKALFDSKNQKQKGDQFLIKVSDDIKFRNQQDWLKLKQKTQSQKSITHQNKINPHNNPSKSRQKVKRPSLNIDSLSSEKQFQIFLKSDSNKFNALKDTKLNQKIDYLCQKMIQPLLKTKTEINGQQFITLSRRQPQKNQENFQNIMLSNFVQSQRLNQNKPQIAMLKTTDSTPKKSLTLREKHTLFKSSQPIKRYKNRQISPIEQQELKSKYHQLDKRLNSLLLSVKQQRTLQA